MKYQNNMYTKCIRRSSKRWINVPICSLILVNLFITFSFIPLRSREQSSLPLHTASSRQKQPK